jgi:GAF domain-containing protein/HAMP domain-containing protein
MTGATTIQQPETATGRRSLPLVARFLIAFIAAAVLPMVVIGTIGIVSSSATQRAQVRDVQDGAARNAANVIDAYLQQTENELTLAVRTRSLQGELSSTTFLDVLLAYNPGFETLTLMNKTGQEIAKRSRYLLFGPQDLSNRANTPEFVFAVRGERYLGPISISQYAEPLVTLAIPMRSTSGEINGVLSAEINLKYMWDIIARLEIGQEGYAYVVDSEGRLIAHRDSSRVLKGLDLSRQESVRDALLGQPITDSYAGLEGEQVIGTYRSLQQADWLVFVETPTREALSNVYSTLIISAGVIGVALVLSVLLGWYMARIVVQPVRSLQEGTAIIGGGDLAHRIDIRTRDEIGALASAFNAMAAQLQDTIDTLEQRVAERTRGLQTAAEVTRATTSVLDPDELLRQVVELVRERFNLYYAGLFLLDEERRWAVLRAGTGEAGQRMLIQGHRLGVGGESMIGQCTARDEARIALDVGEEAVHFDNPLLPETRSEMALPLRSRGRVIGAMTVQSVEEAGFDDADVAVMQTMADQVAIAIDNARLFAETQAALEEAEATHRRYLGRAWGEYVRTRASSGYAQTEVGMVPLGERTLPVAQQAMLEQRTLTSDGRSGKEGEGGPSLPRLVTPILRRGQPIGALGLQRAKGGQLWTAEEIALAEAIAEQFALAADNLRLLDETQRRAVRDRLTSEITARMRETLNVQTVLETAANEIYQALGLDKVVLRLAMEETDDRSSP